VQASTVDDERAGRIATSALELFRQADAQRDQELVQLDAALSGGSVFVVRDEERLIAATTTPGPTAGLVFYDLKSALRSFAEPPTGGRFQVRASACSTTWASAARASSRSTGPIRKSLPCWTSL